ncbi:MAG: PP2C family protein-serine/threonine phosphatase [Negativicutes bacterium]|jgi:sigma-B regulation protein RsbU (phosphoserine phosphatase)
MNSANFGDIFDILNYMALELSLIYFIARTRIVSRMLFERITLINIIVAGFIGGAMAVISNIYFTHFLDWYIIGVAPQTSLLFGMLFGVKAGIAVGTTSVFFASFAGSHPSYYSLVTAGLGLFGGLFRRYIGLPWNNLEKSTLFMFLVYAIVTTVFSLSGRFDMSLWHEVLFTMFFKTLINVWVFYVIAHLFSEKNTLATKDLLTTELDIAAQLQQKIIPDFLAIELPANLDITACLQPAKSVGGDWCDCTITDDRACFVIGDVSDKGIPAALFMAASCVAFRTNLDSIYKSPAEVMQLANNSLFETNNCFMFVTACCAEIDLKTGKLRYCSVGHPPFVLLRHNQLQLFSATDKGVLGIRKKSSPYNLSSLQLEANDILIFVTDGVTEATDNTGKLFGQARINSAITNNAITSAEQATRMLLAGIAGFVGDTPQSDDICIVAVRYAPTREVPANAN